MASLAMLLAMGAFFGALVLSSIMKRRAWSQLDEAHRATVLDVFTGRFRRRLVPIIVLVVVFLTVSQITPGSPWLVDAVFWVGLPCYALTITVLDALQLRKMAMPSSYLRSWLASRAVFWAGAVFLLAGFYAAGIR